MLAVSQEIKHYMVFKRSVVCVHSNTNINVRFCDISDYLTVITDLMKLLNMQFQFCVYVLPV